MSSSVVPEVHINAEQGPCELDGAKTPGPHVTHGVAGLLSVSSVPAAHVNDEQDPVDPAGT